MRVRWHEGTGGARMPMPTFQCNSCRRRFNRLTGTPVARLRHPDKLYKFVPLLSRQMSYKEAAEILQVDYSAVAKRALPYPYFGFDRLASNSSVSSCSRKNC